MGHAMFEEIEELESYQLVIRPEKMNLGFHVAMIPLNVLRSPLWKCHDERKQHFSEKRQ
jgi:hypothetical protein